MKIKIFILCLLMLFVFALFWSFFYLLYKRITSKKWAIVQATIQKVDLKWYTEYDHDFSKKDVKNKLTMAYQYNYNGRSFNNDKIYFNNSYLQSVKINKKIYSRLQNAKIVKIYVNPKNPADSVLVRRLIFPILLSFIIGTFCFLMSLKLIDDIYKAKRFNESHDDILFGLFISIFILGILACFFEKTQYYIEALKNK